MERVVLIRHGHEPMDDRVTVFMHRCGLEPETRRPFAGDTLGEVDDSVVASVVYGGPFNVFETDRHPFLLEEHRWIEQCLTRNVPILGICQGAQSIAHVLGARCGPLVGEPHEFGYYSIQPTEPGRALFPDQLWVCQSHFHGFDLPAGAERLASSELFPQQAMRYGRSAYAFQFHAEVTPAGFRRWQDADWAAYGKPHAQSREEQDRLQVQHDAAQGRWFEGFLDDFFGPALSRPFGAKSTERLSGMRAAQT